MSNLATLTIFIPLVTSACIRMGTEHKQKYADILHHADKVVVLSENYYSQCYAHRNDYMISHACRLIAYWDRKSAGGTSYTFNKAQKKKLVIHNLF